jgi:hypothetical protein
MDQPNYGPKAYTTHATWAKDERSIDYAHLGTPFDGSNFRLTAAHLRELCAANHFEIPSSQNLVLFGLRGCRPVDVEEIGFADSCELQEYEPDHANFRCTLGVWDVKAGRIATFLGSTVPNWQGIHHQEANGGHECNLLPTGRYDYVVGVHLAGSSNEIIGVFRQAPANYVVLRSEEDHEYRVTDHFEKWEPGDNIHPSRILKDVAFSSVGCMTVPGQYSKKHGHSGMWAEFRNRAGLANHPADQHGRPYTFILLTGREAHLAANGSPEAKRDRLRFGSTGDLVKKLQASLNLSASGKMSPDTVLALVKQQRANKQPSTGVYV